jgi:hypothetical protein
MSRQKLNTGNLTEDQKVPFKMNEKKRVIQREYSNTYIVLFSTDMQLHSCMMNKIKRKYGRQYKGTL